MFSASSDDIIDDTASSDDIVDDSTSADDIVDDPISSEDIVNYLIKDMNDNLDDLLFINDNQPLGVNIYNGDKKISPEDICKEWYNENKFYNYDIDKFQKKAIHFTQIVWKNTTEVGFAFTSKKSKKCIGVALYYPAGNIFDEFKDNVKPISK